MIRKRPSIFGLKIKEGYTLKRMQYFGYVFLYSFLEQVILKINNPKTLVTYETDFSVWTLILTLFLSYYFARAQSYRLMDICPNGNPNNMIFIAFTIVVVLAFLFIFLPIFGFILGILWGIYLLVTPGKTTHKVISQDILDQNDNLQLSRKTQLSNSHEKRFVDQKIEAIVDFDNTNINDYLILVNGYKQYLAENKLPPSNYKEAQIIYFLSEEMDKLLDIIKKNHTFLPSGKDINRVVNRFIAIKEFCDVEKGDKLVSKEFQELKKFGVGAIKENSFPYNLLKEEYRNDAESIVFTVNNYNDLFENYRNYLDSRDLPESLYTSEKFIEQLDRIGQLVVDKFVDSNLKLPTSKVLNTTVFRFLALNEILHPERAQVIYNTEIREMILYGAAYLNDKKFPI